MRLTFVAFATFLAAVPVEAAGDDAAPRQGSTATAEARRAVTALRIDTNERIVIDGRLDEAVWSRAIPARDFRQQDPDNGAPATEPTEVRVLFTRDALYFGVTCFDSEPDKWLGYQRRRDEFLQADDRFMWNIDTYNTEQSSYFFEMNPSGLMGDALRNGNGQNRQWDGIWDARVVHSNIGWTLEVEIPFRSLNFDPAAEVWGINFQRTVRRKNEESVWSGWLRNQGLNRLSNAGALEGLRDISQGHSLDVKPYVLATTESAPGQGSPKWTSSGDFGGDVFYNPLPSLRTNLTINTDFAQTEVDQRLVNLTRFPQFFPEKRDFFLDGSTFFDFQSNAAGGNSLLPFFSRRIGLDGNGNPQKIDVGAKLAGQFGRTDVGALYVKTGDEDDGGVQGEGFTVLRAKRRLFRQSYIGALFTQRQGPAISTTQTMGVDFTMATSTFLGARNLSVGGFAVNTHGAGAEGRNNAFGVQVDYPNDPVVASFLFREIQEHYRADVGFTPRTGYRRTAASLVRTLRPNNHPLVRSVAVGGDVTFQADTRDNTLLNRDVNLQVVNLTTHSGDGLLFSILPTYERLERDFPISKAITLPSGSTYEWTRYRLQLTSAQRRKVAFSPTVELGSFYGGSRRKLAFDLNLRLRPGVIIYSSAEWNHVNLPAGAFDTRLYRLVPELQFTPRIAWVNNIQYDTQSSVIGWQSRFRWILTPGSDLYIVYTRNWMDDPLTHHIYTLNERAASKALYTWRF